MKKISEIVANAPIVFRLEHPITLTEIQIKDFDGHNFWMENEEGEGMTVSKVKLTKFLDRVTKDFNKLFRKWF